MATTFDSITLSNGNLTSTGSLSGPWRSVRGTLGWDSGKHYWEVTLTTIPGASAFMTGIDTGDMATTDFPGANANGWGYYEWNGQVYAEGVGAAYGDVVTAGQVLGVALDCDNNKLFWSIQDVWQNSADPVAGTGGKAINAATTYYPWFGHNYTGCVHTVNFGAEGPIGTIPNGYAMPDYVPPGGRIFIANRVNLLRRRQR
jgi:hypothetical protein